MKGTVIIMKKLLSLFVCVVLVVSCLSAFTLTASAHSTAEANEAIDLLANCSLKLTFANGKVLFDGKDISIFKVADVDKDFNYTLCGDFVDPTVRLSDFESQDDYDTLAETLYSLSLLKHIKSTADGKTDNKGEVTFSNLSTGLYLVSPLGVQIDHMIYKFVPFIVAVPDASIDGTWDYDIEAFPKSSVSEEEKIEYKIVVVWDDADNKGGRPSSINFDLFDDGEKADSTTVYSKDDWTYKWMAYDDGSVWTVAETNLPEGYSTTIVRTGNTFTVTNTYYLAPKTSDLSNITPFAVAMFVSAVALVGCSIVLLRKKA